MRVEIINLITLGDEILTSPLICYVLLRVSKNRENSPLGALWSFPPWNLRYPWRKIFEHWGKFKLQFLLQNISNRHVIFSIPSHLCSKAGYGFILFCFYFCSFALQAKQANCDLWTTKNFFFSFFLLLLDFSFCFLSQSKRNRMKNTETSWYSVLFCIFFQFKSYKYDN